MFIQKPWYKKESPIITGTIFGAQWSGGPSPDFTRTDDAAGFSDPNPYYATMTSTPSSPFDSVMPWSGIRRVYDVRAGELVEIPKFWYRWVYPSEGVRKLQISNQPADGFYTSPAHADRGDGVGERDYVYVSRYRCGYNDYRSVSGITPKNFTNRAKFRTNIHNLGSNIWQYDFAMHWTILMLYLVEFASWNYKEKAFVGGTSTIVAGYTDNMPYHTGTIANTKQETGGMQYRYIEGFWDGYRTFLDGIYGQNKNIYCIKNPAEFADKDVGTFIGAVLQNGYVNGYVKELTIPLESGFEYAAFPSKIGGSDTTYICSYFGTVSLTSVVVSVFNTFYLRVDGSASTSAGADEYARLMVLPSSRLT